MNNNQTPKELDPSVEKEVITGLPSDYFEPEFPASPVKNGEDDNQNNHKLDNSDNHDNSNNHDNHDNSDNHDSYNDSDKSNEAEVGDAKTDSLNRWLGTPKIRFTVLAGCIGLVVLGVGGIMINNAISSPEQEVVRGEVAVPKTKIGASAIVNNEQATHIREQQVKAGETAEKKGETYLAPIVTVADTDKEELDAPTQPGLKNPVITNDRTFKDPEGRVYTVDQAVGLLNSGAQIEGVTKGKGSIVDVNINTPTPQNTATSNAPRSATAAPPEKVIFEPHVIKPYAPNNSGATAIQSELMAEQTAALEKSAKDVDEWQDQYLDIRLKKANMVNQKTQLAFSEQVGAIEKTLKAKPESQQNPNGFSTRIYSQPTVIEAPTTQGESSQATKQQALSSSSKPVIYAGESYRAVLKNQVNSDHGNEVIATLLNGPLKGSTLMGTIFKTNNNIQFNFTRLLRKGKTEINVVAVGRQLGDNSSGMADDIKKHYLVRYSALVASSALSGVGKSYEQTSGSNATISGSGTVVTTSTDPTNDRIIGNAVGELGNEISQEIDDLTQKPTTYITNNGKIFNVFFNQNVFNSLEETTSTKAN